MTIIFLCKDSSSKKNSYFQKGINKSIRKIRPRHEKRCNHNNIVYFPIIWIALRREIERAKEKQTQLLVFKNLQKTNNSICGIFVSFFFPIVKFFLLF